MENKKPVAHFSAPQVLDDSRIIRVPADVPKIPAALLRRGSRALCEREAFGLLAANRAFLDVVFAFAVSHRARTRHAPRETAKLFHKDRAKIFSDQ